MARDDYTSTVRSLALPIDDNDPDSSPSSPRFSTDQTPSWRRRSPSTSQPTYRRPPPPQPSRRAKWLRTANDTYARWEALWYSLTPVQQLGLVLIGLFFFVLTVLFLVYNRSLFAYLQPAMKKWREMRGGWLILWIMTFSVSFPPLIGYSTCVTLAGFVFGMKGWLIVATASVAGSTAAFIVSRGLLRGFVTRLAERNAQFAALSAVLKHDGLKLLIMIRLCPLPYSLSNGAISTIPSVTWQNFGLATALASPKLLLAVFVGSRLGDLAENGDKMDVGTKVVSYLGIAVGVFAGLGTGWWVYARTKARSRQLEQEGAGSPTSPRRRSSGGGQFSDDVDERNPVGRREDDGYSMHTTYEDDLEGGRGGAYRDEFTDDEDARERDVFDDGDGFSIGSEGGSEDKR